MILFACFNWPSFVQALGLSGQKLLGVPVVIQPSQAEKNRVGNYSDPMVRPEKGPMKLYIGSLHFNITEDMLKGEQEGSEYSQ